MTQAQENSLEEALRLAADEPSYRPEFYRLLLESSVYILGHSDGPPSGTRTLEAGENISIRNWERDDGSPVIPFFTSLAALQKAIEEETTYLKLPARSLFEMTRGAVLVLNPRSPYGKEFFPNEIEALLASGLNRLPEQRVTKEETQVLLGQPANYPSKMVDALTAFLAKRSNVKAAYLALMHDPSQDDKPRLLVGIDAEGDVEQIIREAGVVAAGTSPDGEPVDLVRIEGGDRGLSEYFIREVKPFYERSWGSRLKSIFCVGRA
jgi:hypothetical protein